MLDKDEKAYPIAYPIGTVQETVQKNTCDGKANSAKATIMERLSGDSQQVIKINSDSERALKLRMDVFIANRVIKDGLDEGVIDQIEADRLGKIPPWQRLEAVDSVRGAIRIILSKRILSRSNIKSK